MARITKASQEILDTFGFEVGEAPEKDTSRRSKYDDMWEAARNFCESNPGTTIKVRTYTNASAAYSDAKAINNGEHRHFSDGAKWQAVAAKSETDVSEDDKPLHAIWLTYNGE
jgi:hypothetical protein